MLTYFKYTTETNTTSKISSLYIRDHDNFIVLDEEFIKSVIIDIYLDNNKEIKFGRLNIYVDDELWITSDYQMFGYKNIIIDNTTHKIDNDKIELKFVKKSF